MEKRGTNIEKESIKVRFYGRCSACRLLSFILSLVPFSMQPKMLETTDTHTHARILLFHSLLSFFYLSPNTIRPTRTIGIVCSTDFAHNFTANCIVCIQKRYVWFVFYEDMDPLIGTFATINFFPLRFSIKFIYGQGHRLY